MRGALWETAGRLIVSDSGEFGVYNVVITSGSTQFFRSVSDMDVEGDGGAIAVCKNLAQDMALTDMPCETAVKCLHTLAARVAKTVDALEGAAGTGSTWSCLQMPEP